MGNLKIDIDDDMFTSLLIHRLKEDYKLCRERLKEHIEQGVCTEEYVFDAKLRLGLEAVLHYYLPEASAIEFIENTK